MKAIPFEIQGVEWVRVQPVNSATHTDQYMYKPFMIIDGFRIYGKPNDMVALEDFVSESGIQYKKYETF